MGGVNFSLDHGTETCSGLVIYITVDYQEEIVLCKSREITVFLLWVVIDEISAALDSVSIWLRNNKMKNLSKADWEDKPQIVPFAYYEMSNVCLIHIYSFVLGIAVELQCL